MANYKQVGYGSQGSEVTELQKLLNQNGYKLDEDGIFGSKTQAAVKDYQQKNNLDVDGIVGNNTWTALTSMSTGSNASSGSTSTGSQNTGTTAPEFKYDAYTESDTVKQAQELLNQQLAQKPGAYQSAWQTQLNDAINKILNREKFSYDLNGDALYQQYKDQYTTQGKMAMMDTMGQAQAMTGGYGNSYAQGVGQQAYQGHLQQLNDKVPELYQLALSKYQMEGDQMYDQAALLAQMENQDYGRYRDQMGDWQTERDRLQDQYYTERDYDYGKWADGRDFAYGKYSDDRAYAYQTERDKIADEQWKAEFDEAVRQFNYKNGINTSTGGSTNGGDGDNEDTNPNPKGRTYNNGSYSEEFVKRAQTFVGAEADGKWGSDSAAKAKAMGYNSLAEVIADIQGRYNPGGSGVSPTFDKEYTEANNAAQNFIKNLPYLHGGGDVETWNKVVDERLEKAYESGKLNATAVEIVLKKIGLK